MRAIDNAGNVSAWAPSSAGPGNTVKIDTTPPTAPIVAGGTGGWSAAASAHRLGVGLDRHRPGRA